MQQEPSQTGWELLTQHDEATQVLAALLDLDPETEYTRSDIADAAGIPMKTLYLTDAIEAFVDIGLLQRSGGGESDTETRFTLNGDSEVLTAARAFDEAVASASDRPERV